MAISHDEGGFGDPAWPRFSTSAVPGAAPAPNPVPGPVPNPVPGPDVAPVTDAPIDPFASLPPIPPPSVPGAGGPPPVAGFGDPSARTLPEWVSARAPQPPLPPPPLPPPDPELLDPLRPGHLRPGLILPGAVAGAAVASGGTTAGAAAVPPVAPPLSPSPGANPDAAPPAPSATHPIGKIDPTPAPGPSISPFVPSNRRPEPAELVVSSGFRGVIPVAVGVLVLGAIAIGSLVLSQDNSSGSIATADRPAAQTRDALVADADPSTTTRPAPTGPPTTVVAPQTTPETVVPAISEVSSPPTTLRSVPAIPATTIPFSVTPRVFVAPPRPATTTPSAAPSVTPAATVWPGVAAVPYAAGDGSFNVTMPGNPNVVSSGSGSGVSEYSVGLAGGVTLAVGHDNTPVDASLSPDQLMPFYAQQVASSVGSTAWLGTPADLYGGRVLDSAVLFDGGVLRSRTAIVNGHRYWVTLVVPAASVSSTQAMAAFQQALDSLVINDVVVTPTPTTTTTTVAPVTTTTEVATTTTTLP